MLVSWQDLEFTGFFFSGCRSDIDKKVTDELPTNRPEWMFKRVRPSRRCFTFCFRCLPFVPLQVVFAPDAIANLQVEYQCQ